ncbi:asparaginase domain-containing protein [Solemya velesiana gill symbiont]|uniref:Asparaginase n=1 Tax=Solemya velesiana gill symbiont TaxID=1918948 RepID=A0A1T2KYF2_9GAMM|nr:asparaginase domain-containing protein [Solemya velesiana gill symbiont]OOZ37898.1 asparaginase [Solemya velesiana gill symbiont]
MFIKILTTGGTIDKIYFDAKSEFQVGDPQITELLHEANVSFNFEVDSIMRKDSLEITDNDRRLIHDRAAGEPAERILITHGTDSMVETGRALMDIPGKTVVLTGAIQPARLRVNDAIFNIGFAVSAVQQLPPGIYIAMNGRVFDPSGSRKNVAENRFENLAG